MHIGNVKRKSQVSFSQVEDFKTLFKPNLP